MKVFIAELQHSEMKTRPGRFVPLAAGYLSAYLCQHLPQVDTKIFTNANALLDAVDEEKPDVVGFSVRFWSEKLSFFCADYIKQKFPDTVIVGGGPSIDDIESEIFRFLQEHSNFDVLIPNEGEVGFMALVSSMMLNQGWDKNIVVDGCYNIGTDGSLRKGKYSTVELDQLPSPYLSGTLDKFLEDGYDVLFETTRGCPYRCKFCVDGSKNTIKVRRASMEHVVEEFEYIKNKSTSDFMMITDLNFGILGKRDVNIAKLVNQSHLTGNFPQILSAYSFKYLNDDNREIAFMFKDQAERTIAFQSMDDGVVKEVGRYNLKKEDFYDDLEWANKTGVRLNAEFIFGFAGEKSENFIGNIESLIKSGANRILLYNLKLISGSDLAVPSFREKYKFESKFRRFGRNYGVYRGHPIIETEEIVTGATSFDFEDFMKVRRYGLFLNFSILLGYMRDVISILINLGLPGEKLVRFLSEEAKKHGNALSSLMEEYERRANSELYNSHDGAVSEENTKLISGEQLPEARLDWIFVGKLILDKTVLMDSFDLVLRFVRMESDDPTLADFISEYLHTVLINQIVAFRNEEPDNIVIDSRINLDRIYNNKIKISEIFSKNKTQQYNLQLSARAAEHIKGLNIEGNSVIDETDIQDIFIKLGDTADNCLLRKVDKIKDEPSVQNTRQLA